MSDTSELDTKKRPSLTDEVGRFSERLKNAFDGRSVRAIAREAGCSESVIRQYLTGASEPGRQILVAIARLTNVSLQWLATGEGPMRPGTHVATDRDDTVAIPLYNVTGSAGGGSLNDSEHVEKVVYCSPSFISRFLGILPRQLCMIHISGNSMEPDLPSNSIAWVDRSATEIKTDGVYVVRIDGMIMVKQVQMLPGGVIEISSINPAYKPFRISPQNPPSDFAILGRVICTFKKL